MNIYNFIRISMQDTVRHTCKETGKDDKVDSSISNKDNTAVPSIHSALPIQANGTFRLRARSKTKALSLLVKTSSTFTNSLFWK